MTGMALLARLRGQRAELAAAPKTKKLVVLYASQTGTAQEIGKTIAAEATSAGLEAQAYAFNEFGFENLTAEKAPVVVIVASSTGDGDPPDNSAKFLVTLKRKSQPEGLLKGIKYACLGLGDSNYTRFCAVPKAFVKRFEDLGAENFHPNIEVDEVDGIEESVEKWCADLQPALLSVCKGVAGGKTAAPAVNGSSAPKDAPAPAPAAPAAPAPPAAKVPPPVEAAPPAAKAIPPVQAAAPAPQAVPLTGSAALLARMRSQRSQPQPKNKTIVVLYASQTGTAQEIAKGIAAEATASGLKAQAYGFNEFGFDNLTPQKAPVVVIVASSTGDGDPPDNSAKFLVTLKRKTQPEGLLKGIKYTCLGLGDSNYTRFCAVPRAFRKRFDDLGAENFHPNIDVDEVDGIEEAVEKWCAELQPALAAVCKEEAAAPPAATAPAAAVKAETAQPKQELVGVPALLACSISLKWEEDASKATTVAAAESQHPTAQELEVRDAAGLYSPEAPFWAKVSACRNLCSSQSDREVLHMEVDLSGSGMDCQPGDALGVMPRNSPALVEGILAHLGADGSRVFSVATADGSPAPEKLSHLGWPCTLRHALSAGCDLTGPPKKSLIRMLAEHCTDESEKHQLLFLCSRGGRDEYKSDIATGQPSLLDMLKRFPSCKPPMANLLEALPALAPRLYSLSSSNLQHPNAAHVAFSVVKYSTPRYGEHQGVATTWLKSACLNDAGECVSPRLAVFLRPNQSFRPPADLSAPLIMIGPGTGVAPFRGFLQDRKAKAAQQGTKLGSSWLFFGCRRREEDFLYGAELEGFAADGTLGHLELAFSREGADKVYVQHRMKARGAELCADVLADNSFVMVCGDGGNMAKDVNQCLVDLLVEHGGMTAAAASEKLAEMTKQRRYVRDIWS